MSRPRVQGEPFHPKHPARETAAKLCYRQPVITIEAKPPLDSFLHQDQPPQ